MFKLCLVFVYNMSRQHLISIFRTPPTPKPSPRPTPKKSVPKKPIPASEPKKHTFDGYKPKKIAGALNDNHIEYKSEGVKDISMRKYLESVTQYLRGVINNFKKSFEQKIQLTMKSKFISSSE